MKETQPFPLLSWKPGNCQFIPLPSPCPVDPDTWADDAACKNLKDLDSYS